MAAGAAARASRSKRVADRARRRRSLAWLLLSFVLFLVSAGDQSGSIPKAALAELTPGGNMLTSANTS